MKFHRNNHPIRHAVLAVTLLAASAAASAADLWLYSGRDFTGATARVSRSEGNLPIGAARSIRVETGIWEACTGHDFTGECRRLTAGDYRELGGRYGDTILSVRDVTYGQGSVSYTPPRLQLFDGRDFRGRMVNLEQSVADFDQGSQRIGSPASAIVTGGTWEVCTDYNYGGRCQALPPGQYNDLGAQLNYRIVSARVLEQPTGFAPPALPSPPPPPPPPVASQVNPLAALIGAVAGGVIANQIQPPPPAPYVSSGAGAGVYDQGRIEVYADVDFRGAVLRIDGDLNNLRNSGFNDRIQSMRIFSGNWEACEDRDYAGACLVFGPGDYRRLPPQLDRSISSMRRIGADPSWGGITPGGQNYLVLDPNASRSRHPVWLYEHGNFRGRTVRAVGDVNDLSSSGLNDTASSIFISFGNWQFCADANYRGACFTLGPGQYSEMPQGMNDAISSFRRVR